MGGWEQVAGLEQQPQSHLDLGLPIREPRPEILGVDPPVFAVVAVGAVALLREAVEFALERLPGQLQLLQAFVEQLPHSGFQTRGAVTRMGRPQTSDDRAQQAWKPPFENSRRYRQATGRIQGPEFADRARR